VPGTTVMGFLDDDPMLHNRVADTLMIHDPASLRSLIRRVDATDVLITIPSTSGAQRGRILKRLEPFGLRVRTMPNVDDLAAGRVRVSDPREPGMHELLGRDPVTATPELLGRHIRDKDVMVTGAGGSIGSELCRQIVQCRPRQLLLLELTEYALFQIERELVNRMRLDGNANVEIVPLLGSVRDAARMKRIFAAFHPHTVYHAAAYKHVPLVEANPCEGIRNNVWGTLVCAHAARKYGTENFVLVSTDKAVRPTNIMGASKRLAELVLQALDAQQGDRNGHAGSNGTCYCMVRFGNVLNSSGSVIPMFRQQILNGGPLTLTHPDVTRFFMTIPEAAQLVIQAGAMAQGGEVFLLDMGEPVRVGDLARRMTALSGLCVKDAGNPDGEIEIEIIGLRPGEKLYEELLIGENPEATGHSRIMMARESCIPWNQLESSLQRLKFLIQKSDVAGVKELLAELVSGYRPELQRPAGLPGRRALSGDMVSVDAHAAEVVGEVHAHYEPSTVTGRSVTSV
jgi:FlaA1/EpsC-like NDP-sugar epimerase